MDLPKYHGNHNTLCKGCSGKGLLLCCDYCPLAYHPACLTPPLKEQPSDYWMCPQCAQELENRLCKCQSKRSDAKPVHKGKTTSHVFTSGYRGVYSRSGKWNAQIQYNGKKVYLGSYSSEEEAAHAYDIAAKRYHGSKAVLNFHTNENGSSRNPYQINSKPTGSLMEPEEPLFNQSRSQSVQEPSVLPTPVVYVDAKECIDCIKQNRETLLQKCMN
ncbi:hypothetical protein BLSTO_00223 [Blastocystis sp. subtype 1]